VSGPEPGGYPDIGDLTGPPGEGGETLRQVRHDLGLASQPGPPEPRGGYPPVHELAEGLGLA
jgi:hypothetical protein